MPLSDLIIKLNKRNYIIVALRLRFESLKRELIKKLCAIYRKSEIKLMYFISLF